MGLRELKDTTSKYFYKGFQLIVENDKVVILAPQIRGRKVFVAKSIVEAKFWIENDWNRV